MTVERVYLAQSMVYPSDDRRLVLVARKSVLVLVDLVSTESQRAKPLGSVLVFNAAGAQVAEVALQPPTTELQAPGSTPPTPSFASFYSATVPADAVAAGMKLRVQFGNGGVVRTLQPAVGAGNAVSLIAVPIRIGGIEGKVFAGAGNAIQVRAPVNHVDMPLRAAYTSTSVRSLPTDDWYRAMAAVLAELRQMRDLEQKGEHVFYQGYVPKRTSGLTGLGSVGGSVSVVADLWGTSAADILPSVAIHELGHNFGLQHAPCGGPDDADSSYPYANALLGAASRYIWGFNSDTASFVDARNTAQHDVMSYCRGDTFSDYNYEKIQLNLSASGFETSAMPKVPAELLSVAGTVFEDTVTLRPLKAFQGMASTPHGGRYVLRVTGAKGISEHAFEPEVVNHDARRFTFAFSIPHPGSIDRVQVLRNGRVLLEQSAVAAQGLPIDVQQRAANAVRLNELGLQLSASWDEAIWPFLTVTHVGSSRTTLVQDATGGFATLPLGSLPKGGSFEVILSEGLNSTRLSRPR